MGQQQGLFNGILSQLGAGGGYGSAASGMMGLLGPLSGIYGQMMSPGGAGAMGSRDDAAVHAAGQQSTGAGCVQPGSTHRA